MLDLLQTRSNIRPVVFLGLLHLCIEVADLGLQLFNLFSGVVVKVMNHIFLYLEHVTLDLSLVKLVLIVFLKNFQFI